MPSICEHLEPLEAELERRGVRLGEPMPSPYGPEWGFWSEVNCTFDAASLRKRLGLADFIRFEEYDGRVAGSDATFYCPRCTGRSWVAILRTQARPHRAFPDP